MRERIVELLKNTKERIIGQDRYVNSAVLIAIAEFEGKEYIVLEKRAVEIRQGGEISLPGGKCDKKDKNFGIEIFEPYCWLNAWISTAKGRFVYHVGFCIK